ncbi:hypothetical protein [Streptomyces sp. YGL11-2]|uniref:hypothetical protein n=1 Tax=Streptomyces sp. YGL11-2 TaxID=3414028 RepID=UPI003CED7483
MESGPQSARKYPPWATSPAFLSVLFLFPATAGFLLFWLSPGEFMNNDDLAAFSIGIGSVFALWFGLGVWVSGRVGDVLGLFRMAGRAPAIPHRLLLAIWLLGSAAIGALLHWQDGPPACLTGPGWPCVLEPGFRWRITTVVLLGLWSAGPAVVVIWLVAERLRQLRALFEEEPCNVTLPGRTVDELRTLQDCLVASLVAIGIALSAATLVIIAVQLLLNGLAHTFWTPIYSSRGWHIPPGDFIVVKERFVVLIGTFFTGVFAAVYVPTLLSWRRRAYELVNIVYTTPLTGRPSETWTQGRARMMALLGLNVGLAKRLSNALVVLAPLAVGLLSKLSKKH